MRAWGRTAPTSKPAHIELRMLPEYPLKMLFMNILVHEMVHTWEHQHHNIMGHGKRFFKWAPRIKRTTTLELTHKVGEEDFT